MPPNRRRIRRPLAPRAVIAGCALLLAGCGGSSHTATTVTSTMPAATKTVTVTVAPPPPPGPKTTIEANGTFIVGSDIAPGTYRSAGNYGCYWARLRSLDTGDIIDNNVNDGPQAVQILPTDRAFMTRNCAAWQKVG